MTSRALLVVSLQVWALHALIMGAVAAASVPAYRTSATEAVFDVAVNRQLVYGVVYVVVGALLLWKAWAVARALLPERGDRPLCGRGIFEAAVACAGVTALVVGLEGLLAVLLYPYADVWVPGDLLDVIGDTDERETRYAVAVCTAAALAMATPRIVALLGRRTNEGAQ